MQSSLITAFAALLFISITNALATPLALGTLRRAHKPARLAASADSAKYEGILLINDRTIAEHNLNLIMSHIGPGYFLRSVKDSTSYYLPHDFYSETQLRARSPHLEPEDVEYSLERMAAAAKKKPAAAKKGTKKGTKQGKRKGKG